MTSAFQVSAESLKAELDQCREEIARLKRMLTPPALPPMLGTRLEGLKFICLGTCSMEFLSWNAGKVKCHADHMLFGSRRHDSIPSVNASAYDAAIVSLTLSQILHEIDGLSYPEIVHLRASWNAESIEDSFARCVVLMREKIVAMHAELKGLPMFLTSFLEPSFDALGLLNNANDLTQLKYFVRGLNDAMRGVAGELSNCYFFDLDEVLNQIGRIHLHDDVEMFSTHSVYVIGDGGVDEDRRSGRVAQIVNPTSIYESYAKVPILYEMIWNRLLDGMKIIRQVDIVKLIIVDLDDTLWRGVAAEDDAGNIDTYFKTSFWPLAFVEALLYFKKRGGLLAICSKNDEIPTRERFRKIWGDGLTLDDFASVKINWQPKSENIATILQEVNLLPESAVFVDDNPREIDEVKARFPSIRTIGFSHYDWRRIVLFSPEMQVARISKESQARTELIRAKIEREKAAEGLSREQWLQSLGLEQRFHTVQGTDDPHFARTMELVNKTNQFNTTGHRWTQSEFESFFAAGGWCLATSLKDKTVDNGIIGIAVVRPGEIVQCVLSCRAFGLGVENAMGAIATRLALLSADEVEASIVDTGKNFTCHGFYEQMGFAQISREENGPLHYRGNIPVEMPVWIKVVLDDRANDLINDDVLVGKGGSA